MYELLYDRGSKPLSKDVPLAAVPVSAPRSTPRFDPPRMDRAALKARQKNVVTACFWVVTLLVLSCAIPVVFMLALAAAYDPGNAAFGFLALLVAGAGCVWVGTVFRLIADVVSGARDSLWKLREDCRRIRQ